jgi:hypothetical protein
VRGSIFLLIGLDEILQQIELDFNQPVAEQEFVVARELFDLWLKPLDEVVGPRQNVLLGSHAPRLPKKFQQGFALHPKE